MNTPDSFPNELDLGRTVPDYGEPKLTSSDAETPKKTKKVFPRLYIDDADGLGTIPREGYAMIYYKRKRVSVEEGDKGERSSADLEVQSISFPEVTKEEEDKDLTTAMEELMGEHAEPDDETESGEEPEDDEDEETE
jgi:hypothetical protein